MNRLQTYAEISSAGLGLAASVFVGAWAGDYLDSRMGETGLITVGLIIVASIGGIVNLLRAVKRVQVSDAEKDQSDTE